MRVDFGINSAMAEALRMNRWLEEVQGPLARARELDSMSKAMGQAHDMSKYLGFQWDGLSSCGAIAATMRSNNSIIDSISTRSWLNGIDEYNKSIGVYKSDLFDKFNTFGRLELATRAIDPSFIGLSTLTSIQESLGAFKETSAIENALKSYSDFSKISGIYGELLSNHSELFDRISPNVTSWLSKSFLELRNIQGLDANIDISPDGTVTGFGSSITIDDIQDFIRNKTQSVADDKSFEQKIVDFFEPFCSRHPIIKFILLIIILQAIIGVYVNNWTDSSDKILKYIDQQNAALLKEYKSEMKKQRLPPQVLSGYRVVSTRQLTVKSSNSRDSNTVGTLCFGQVVEIVTKKRHWTLVEYRRDNEETCISGWVYTRYLEQLK